MACTLEWVATSGASVMAATSRKPFSLRCDRSIRMLSRLQAFTSALPASDSPSPVSGEDGKRKGTPSPKMLRRLQTGPIERSPAACSTSSMWRSGSIASAPSMWNSAAMEPRSMAERMSAALRQTVSAPSEARSSRKRIEAMASVDWLASARESSAGSPAFSPAPGGGPEMSMGLPTGGGKTAKNPPAKPPCRARGRSRWPLGVPSRNMRSGSAPPMLMSLSSTSLWPSKTGMRSRSVMRAFQYPERADAKRAGSRPS